MTCTQHNNAIICTPCFKKLKRKGTSTRAVYIEFHWMCGPTFYYGYNTPHERMLDWWEVPEWALQEYYALPSPITFGDNNYSFL